MRPLQCHTTFTLASSTVSPCLLRLSYDGPCFLALHRPQLVQHIVCVFAPRKGSPPLSLRRVYYLPRVRAELVRGAQMAPYFGLYGQQAFLIITVDACVVQDAIKSGEGTSSGPMLFVAGFGPKAFVAAEPSKALLREVKAKSRYPSESTSSSSGFCLLASHTTVTTWLWTSSSNRVWGCEELDLKDPAHNSEDVSAMRGAIPSINPALRVDLHFSPNHWTQGGRPPGPAIHAVDFGLVI
ncbi:hypothetical protein D9619_007709 [Psilocybe cf. subviscida]|uniref:Uncharacterized protein n=1 Tax=Psilocybe cf. subviscida TaxID=2480587 RepID=A0A8H5ATW5_9AGAR|nr:hypothetical protein D9619_007709 [Psilocybe cf. subviscida]